MYRKRLFRFVAGDSPLDCDCASPADAVHVPPASAPVRAPGIQDLPAGPCWCVATGGCLTMSTVLRSNWSSLLGRLFECDLLLPKSAANFREPCQPGCESLVTHSDITCVSRRSPRLLKSGLARRFICFHSGSGSTERKPSAMERQRRMATRKSCTGSAAKPSLALSHSSSTRSAQ